MNIIIATFNYIMYMMESVKSQKSQIHEHLVRSRDGSSKCCQNTKKTGRDVSIIDGCYFVRVLIEDGYLYSLSQSCIRMLFCCDTHQLEYITKGHIAMHTILF